MTNNRKGLSLIELVLTLALVGIVIQVIYSVFFVGTTSYSVSTNKGFSQQDVRLVSDFITNELKYVSAFSDTQLDFTDDYYSISIEEIDGKTKIVKSFYNYNDKGTEDISDDELETSVLKSLPGDMDEISIITNLTDMEKANVIMSRTLDEYGFGNQSGGFELPIEVSFINSVSNFNEIDLDLVAGDILYYSVSGMTETKREITITKMPSGDGEDDTNTDTTQYTISFVTNNDITLDPISGTIDSDIVLNFTLIKTGYVFDGWYENFEFTGTRYTNSYAINGDATLYAKWVSHDDAISLDKSGSNIRVTDWNNNIQEGIENTLFKVGNEKYVIVRLPVIYMEGALNGNIGELGITVNGWSGTTGNLEVTADQQYIIISGTGPKNKDGVLDVTVIVEHDGSGKSIEYKFKLES